MALSKHGQGAQWTCTLPSNPPLVSLIVLTCNRPAFLRLALDSAASQTYPHLEVVVVDDGVHAFDSHSGRVPVTVVTLAKRATIGAKRNAGVHKAQGSVILHWDDDDLHHPKQVESLACPIVNNRSELTALTFTYLSRLSRDSASFFQYGKGRGGSDTTGTFLGSLAYHRRVVDSLASSVAVSTGPFPDVSLSEDLHFVERALDRCHRMLPISGVPLVYTRHSSIKNTWTAVNFTSRMASYKATEPPTFVTPDLRAAYVGAEGDAAQRDVCIALQRHPPPDIVHPLRYPYLPSKCCKGGRHQLHSKAQLRKPCGAGAECSETYCGQSKGECSARCTCLGEPRHGQAGKTACGFHCCRYWKRFWLEHPEQCSSMKSVRPLKEHLCGSRPKAT